MAQTGYTPIQIYSTSTAAAVPTAGSLTNSTLGSELAINITDGKLFYKDNANAVQVIGWKVVPTTAGGTGLTSYTAGDLLYYASGTTLTKLGIGAANTVLTSSGSAPQWSTNLNIGSLTATSISDSGNLTFTGTGNRITGDFSNATVANRVAFQTSTANGNTAVLTIPNGTATTAQFMAANNSDPTNASLAQLAALSTDVRILSNILGTGTYLPMTFYTSGSEAMRIGATAGSDRGTLGIGYTSLSGVGQNGLAVLGNVGIGTSSPSALLHVSNVSAKVRIGVDASSQYTDIYRDSATGYTIYNAAQAATFRGHIWQLGGVEAARIQSSGGVSIGDTTDPGAGNLRLGTGNLVIGTAAKGVNFTANTPAAGMTSQLLNWYEEGTWTPTVTSGGGTITSYTSAGTYTRIGRSVTASLTVTITNVGTATGKAIVTLPFTSSSRQCVGSGRENQNTGNMLQIFTNASAANADVFTYNNTTPLATNNVLLLTVTYFV